MTSYEDIENWIFNFLDKNNPDFNDLSPCPFAKKAWIEGKVDVLEVTVEELKINLSQKNKFSKSVIIFVLDPKTVTFENLYTLAKQYTDSTHLVLVDHPEEKEIVGSSLVNQGTHALVFIQSRKEIEEAREILLRTAYYESFSEEYKKELFIR